MSAKKILVVDDEASVRKLVRSYLERDGFSVVEAGTDQYKADTPGSNAPLSGYASPIPPARLHA